METLPSLSKSAANSCPLSTIEADNFQVGRKRLKVKGNQYLLRAYQASGTELSVCILLHSFIPLMNTQQALMGCWYCVPWQRCRINKRDAVFTDLSSIGRGKYQTAAFSGHESSKRKLPMARRASESEAYLPEVGQGSWEGLTGEV